MPVDMAGRGRHYQGGGTTPPARWICPTCQAENLTPLEYGCPACGTGTPQQAEAAHARQVAVDEDALATAIVANTDIAPGYWLNLPGLTEAARATVAVALAAYAERGTPTSDTLPREIALAWARRLLEVEG